MNNIVLVIDVSLSMKRSLNDLIPSKISAVKDTLMFIVRRAMDRDNGLKIGGVVFYGRSIPVLPLTRDKNIVANTLSRLRVLGEGSAPGDGLVEAVKLLRRSYGRKKAVIITDGEFNEGIPLDIAAIYASNHGVKTDFIVLSEQLKGDDLYLIDKTIKLCRGRKYLAPSRNEFIKALYASLNSIEREL